MGQAERGLRLTLVAISAFLVTVIIHLLGQLFSPHAVITEATQVLLMAFLAPVLWVSTNAPRSRFVKIALLALFFSWLGDTLPRFLDGDAGFLAMIAGFLLAQICYMIAFWPYRDRSILKRPVLIAPYVAVAIGLVALCADGAGSLLLPVILYAAVIVGMAILATGLGAYATVGAIIFLVSDALIALRAFADFTLPAHGFIVMLTYVLGQSLLIYSISLHDSAGEVTGRREESGV